MLEARGERRGKRRASEPLEGGRNPDGPALPSTPLEAGRELAGGAGDLFGASGSAQGCHLKGGEFPRRVRDGRLSAAKRPQA